MTDRPETRKVNWNHMVERNRTYARLRSLTRRETPTHVVDPVDAVVGGVAKTATSPREEIQPEDKDTRLAEYR